MHGDSRFYDPRGGDCQVLSEPDERRVRGKSSTEASRSSAGSYAERPARADTTPPASTAPDPLGDAVGGSSGRSTNLRLSATSRLGLAAYSGDRDRSVRAIVIT